MKDSCLFIFHHSSFVLSYILTPTLDSILLVKAYLYFSRSTYTSRYLSRTYARLKSLIYLLFTASTPRICNFRIFIFSIAFCTGVQCFIHRRFCGGWTLIIHAEVITSKYYHLTEDIRFGYRIKSRYLFFRSFAAWVLYCSSYTADKYCRKKSR